MRHRKGRRDLAGSHLGEFQRAIPVQWRVAVNLKPVGRAGQFREAGSCGKGTDRDQPLDRVDSSKAGSKRKGGGAETT